MNNVAIILPNTISALGIKYLLHENFAASAFIYDNMELLMSEETQVFDLFVTDSSLFLDNLQFFLSKKDKTIVLSEHLHTDSSANRINPLDYEDDIVNFFNKYFKDKAEQNSQNKLTQRETSVLKLVAEGCTNKEIADKLNISINTVLTHRKNITSKLGIKSVSGLSVYAMMNGLITAQYHSHS